MEDLRQDGRTCAIISKIHALCGLGQTCAEPGTVHVRLLSRRICSTCSQTRDVRRAYVRDLLSYEIDPADKCNGCTLMCYETVLLVPSKVRVKVAHSYQHKTNV